METILIEPDWGTQAGPANNARSRLYREGLITKTRPSQADAATISDFDRNVASNSRYLSTASNEVLDRYDAAVGRVAAANRYVDMVNEYAARHPNAMADPDFAADAAVAQNLANDLENRGLRNYRSKRPRGRRGRGISARTGRGARQQAQATPPTTRKGRRKKAADAVTGVASRERAQLNLGDDVEGATVTDIDTTGEVGSPVVLKLDRDTEAILKQVNGSAVPTNWREAFPEAKVRGMAWDEADIRNIPTNEAAVV
jgi:hypothetical protein